MRKSPLSPAIITDWTAQLPKLVATLRGLPVTNAILDGEIVVQRADGTTDFQELQSAFRKQRDHDLRYFVFDLLYLNSLDLRGAPLIERKAALSSLLAMTPLPEVTISDHSVGGGPELLAQARTLGLEGIISKRMDQPYRGGRSDQWLKVKCLQREDFVIGGYTNRANSRSGIGALLLGYYDRGHRFLYAGKVGTGFDQDQLESLYSTLQDLGQTRSPFNARGPRPPAARMCHWVNPKIVVQIKFGNWTRDRLLRHASFQGIRDDKSPNEVVHDSITVTAERTSKKSKTKVDEIEITSGPRITNPDRILYPAHKITKRELAKYYEAVSGWILPHLVNRPLVVVRCPAGQSQSCFYQKHPAAGTPETLHRIAITEKTKCEEYLVITRSEDLPLLAQMSALELHCWGSRADKLERPDRLVFDLDPAPEVDWKEVVKAAKDVREFLEELSLISFLKTTGGKGLHLIVPIQRRHDWATVKGFCRRVAELIAVASPQRFTATLAKRARTGKIFIDYLRNSRGATAVAPYSTRANERATVSVPIAWDELSPQLTTDYFTLRNTIQRLESLSVDPWEGIASHSQSLTKPMKKLNELASL